MTPSPSSPPGDAVRTALDEALYALRLIAEGHPAKGADDHYVVIENPQYRPDDGSAPYLTLDVTELLDRAALATPAKVGEDEPAPLPNIELVTIKVAYQDLFDAHRRAIRRFPQLAIPEGGESPVVVRFDGIDYRRDLIEADGRALAAKAAVPDEFAELRKLAEAASPGPWEGPVGLPGPGRHFSVFGTDTHGYPTLAGDCYERDAAFIAAANPATVLRLLSALAATSARADEAEKERDELVVDMETLHDSLNATGDAHDKAEAKVAALTALVTRWQHEIGAEALPFLSPSQPSPEEARKQEQET